MWKDIVLPLLFVLVFFAYMIFWVFTNFHFLLYRREEKPEDGEDRTDDENLARLVESIK